MIYKRNYYLKNNDGHYTIYRRELTKFRTITFNYCRVVVNREKAKAWCRRDFAQMQGFLRFRPVLKAMFS